jgi:hypothetical protein
MVLVMTLFAVSGPLVIGVVILGSLVLLAVLLRTEEDYESEHESEEQENDVSAP